MTSPYVLHGVPCARVTEVIHQTLHSPALAYHAELCAAKMGARHRNPQMAVAAARGNRTAMERGTRIHRYMEALLQDEEPPAGELSDKRWRRVCTDWLVDNAVVSAAAGAQIEVTVVDELHLVAGTFDLQWADVLYDWKTTTKAPDRPYFAHVAQIGAYASMRHRLVDGAVAPVPLAPVGAAQIVYLTPDGYELRDVDLHHAREAWASILALYMIRKTGGYR